MSGHGNQSHPAGPPVKHLDALKLEQLAEGALPTGEAATVQAHLDRCARCAAEFTAFSRLLESLGDLQRFAPSTAFADGVMARVRVAPHESWVTSWIRRIIPQTRRGWMFAAAALIAPAVPVLVLILWLIAQPLLTPSSLWQWTLARTETASQTALAWFFDSMTTSGFLTWTESLFGALQTLPTTAVGGVLAFFGVAIPLSAWGLVHLTRTPVGRNHHAN